MEHTKIYYLHNGDNKPFYIGKSRKPHFRFYNHKQTYGHNIEMVIISEVKNWKRWEKYYIKKYKDLGYNLLNKNEGGGGLDKMSKLTKQKISSHPTRGKKISQSLTGKSMAHKGKPFSKEHKQKIKETRNFLKERPVTWLDHPVLQYDLDKNLIKEFKSQKEAQIYMNKPNSDGIGACCRGNQKTAYGYIWEFKTKN